MAKYTFEELKDKIQEAIIELSKTKNIFGSDNELTIMDGFVNLPIQSDVGGSLVLGGRAIPCVVVVNVKTGQLYTFALAFLLPDVRL